MTDCNTLLPGFPRLSKRKVQADFNGGDITSDGGSVLLGLLDKKLGLLASVAKSLPDERDPRRTRHRLVSLIRQRVYGIACGYEDLNDHQQLRHDIALQTAIGVDEQLSSASTLCRLENTATREHAWAIHKILFDQFVASFNEPPKELILDFDATDDAVHGHQEGGEFHGYYDHYCFLPLYVFCGDQLLAAYLRNSRIDGAKHAGAILRLLVTALRKKWPNVRIVFRGDSGFCRDLILTWCDRNDVDYIVGVAKNSRLRRFGKAAMNEAQALSEETGDTCRVFDEFMYAADSWSRQRRTIIRADHSQKGENPRFIVTTLKGDIQALYEKNYCARGDMENRIKEQQLDLFADRTSCHHWWPNQLRMLWSSLAYTLVERLRHMLLASTELASAQCGTIRLKVLKIGAVVQRNTRTVRLHFSSNYPYQDLFRKIWYLATE